MEVEFRVRHISPLLLTADAVEEEVKFACDQVPIGPDWVSVGEEQESAGDRCGEEGDASFERLVVVGVWIPDSLPGGVEAMAAAVVHLGAEVGVQLISGEAEVPAALGGPLISPHRPPPHAAEAAEHGRRMLWAGAAIVGCRRRFERDP